MEPERNDDKGISVDPGDVFDLMHVLGDSGELLEGAAESVGEILAAVAEGLG